MKPAALILLIMLSACATPASPAPPVHNDVMAGLVANATQTAVSVSADSTRTAVYVAAENAAATEAARVVQAAATAAAASTVDAAFVDVAVNAQAERDRVSLAAFELRLANETRATVTSMELETESNRANNERSAWFWDVFAGVILLLILFVGLGLAKILHRMGGTITHSKTGEVIFANGEFLTDRDAPTPLLIEQTARQVPYTPHNRETVSIPSYRRGLGLPRVEGGRGIIHHFKGEHLSALAKNVESGDIGFRRGTTGGNYGMNDLIGLSDGNKYADIVTAMTGRGWLESVGNRNQWTERGVIEMLEMDGLPHSQNGPGE